MVSQQVETDKGYYCKAHKIFLRKRYILNLSKFFLGWSFLPWNEILQDYLTFLVLALVLQFIQTVSWYNL